MSTADQLEKRMVMLEKGLITREEFDQKKRRLLSGDTDTPTPTPADLLAGSTRKPQSMTGDSVIGCVAKFRYPTKVHQRYHRL